MKIFFINLLVIFSAFYTLAQKPVIQEFPDYFVTRFNHKYIDYDVINDKNIVRFKLGDLLNNLGKEAINNAVGFELSLLDMEIEKLFPNYMTYDSISTSRFGTPVSIPPFWATFRVFTTKDFNGIKYLEFLANSPIVVYIDPPTEIEFTQVPNDSLYSLQNSINSNYPLASINCEEAWDVEVGKKFIKVGVHDSGIDTSHADIDIIIGKGFSPDAYLPIFSFGSDYIGHGTSVAGIIGAKRNNEIGIAGIAGGDMNIPNSGVSLIDMKLGDNIYGEFAAIAMIDGARSVGSYWDWASNAPYPDYYQWTYSAGFGLNLSNHSYQINAKSPKIVIPGKDVAGAGDSIIDIGTFLQGSCQLCREAFLFSLQNGVTNVFARGNHNYGDILAGKPLSYPYDKIPSSTIDDSWYISVGASGTDGKVLNSAINGGIGENFWKSPIGFNLDIIAPGTSGLVVTTRSNQQLPAISSPYRKASGTSLSAPHATGVAALLMSRYNKPCYSNINLDPADIEYILQKSANHVATTPGYDDTTGWGRLDAKKALDMIDFPTFQIVHPIEPPVEQNVIASEMISIHLGEPLYQYLNGPLGSSFPLLINKDYQVEKITMHFKYDFSNYLSPTSQLLDLWIRHSQTNSLGEIMDTTGSPQILGSTGGFVWVTTKDTFGVEPMATIVQVDPTTVEFIGYYYHFVNMYAIDVTSNVFSPNPIDFWYPIDPFQSDPRVAYSIYLQDNNATERFDFPCDSLNILVDPNLAVSTNEMAYFSIFPNPSEGKLKINLFNNISKGEITIQDVNGRAIFSQICESLEKSIEFDLSTLNSGIYFVSFRNEIGSNTVKKWIKL